MAKKQTYIIIHEGFYKSILQDAFTFIGVFALVVANRYFLGDSYSWVIDAMGVVMVVSGLSFLFPDNIKKSCRTKEEFEQAVEEARKAYE